ncbi:hypothetical protein GGR52DRAFT_573837 [Hypoxylon sp. FL1284]|nr:hypothetical protein GGR52DRAFT_573837 [Hypoxylon sp. FL1284]
MAPGKPFTYCEGAPSWNPTSYTADAALRSRVEALLARDDLQGAVAAAFALPPPRRDPYVYHAVVSVTLPEVQHVVTLGGRNGLHAWYRGPAPPSHDEHRPSPVVLPPPPRPDTDAYLSVFDAATSTDAALRSLLANARKGSLRAEVAEYLLSKRYLHPSLAAQLTVPKKAGGKKKKGKTASTSSALPAGENGNNGSGGNTPTTNPTNDPTPAVPPNPYLPFLSWSARNLEWAGPSPSSARAGPMAHHVLPVLMHHFGCACPSHEALSILRSLAAGRGVLDVGSGGGYFAFMLRAYGVRVVPVDSAQSAWRAFWVSDTVIADGAAWLRRRRSVRAALAAKSSGDGTGEADDAAARIDPDESVLLLVYPIVGGTLAGGEEGGFTRAMMDAYGGDTLAVVGTQNRNGYTGFRGMSMDEFVERERADWVKVVQVALPSFPGKDEALFVFQRGPRAPAGDDAAAAAGGAGVVASADAGSGSASNDKDDS